MSYSYYKSTSGSAVPRARLSDDADFQAAKMQAMMGAPLSGTGDGSSSYSYRTTSNRSALPTSLDMDAEMRRMQSEMRSQLSPGTDSGRASSSYSSTSTSGPTSIPIHQDPSSGTTVKKVVITTTSKSNPQATRELESLERDFKRIGKTPDDYHDDFDKLKREIDTGDAYRGSQSTSSQDRLHRMPSHGSGNQHGTTTTTTTRTYDSSGGSFSKPDNGEVVIPVRTSDNTFEDFHMNRWLDHRDNFGSIGSPDLDAHRMDWENRLRGMKTDMFKFSPHSDFGNANIESSRAVSKKKRPLRRSQSLRTTRSYYVDCVSTRNPLGNPEFSIQFDMRDFKAEDINLSTKNGKLVISATHEDKIGKSTSRREFTRSVDLPADIQISMMRSVFSRDGILSITAPIKPPHYDPLPKSVFPASYHHDDPILSSPFTAHEQLASPNTYHSEESRPSYTAATSTQSTPYYGNQVSSKFSTQSSSAEDSVKPLDYTLPVSGYSPEEITISVDGRKVKVQGKHVESRIGGRKIHNEFTKMFDLPPNVDARDIRCYIKDGHTLHVIAHVSEDIQGLVHFIAINKRN